MLFFESLAQLRSARGAGVLVSVLDDEVPLPVLELPVVPFEELRLDELPEVPLFIDEPLRDVPFEPDELPVVPDDVPFEPDDIPVDPVDPVDDVPFEVVPWLAEPVVPPVEPVLPDVCAYATAAMVPMATAAAAARIRWLVMVMVLHVGGPRVAWVAMDFAMAQGH